MIGLADIDGFTCIICIQVCVWLGFPPLKLGYQSLRQNTKLGGPVLWLLLTHNRLSVSK